MYSAQPMLGPQPRCCGCIPLRIGSGIICVFWAGISMYLAVLSFQNSSLFYSYMAQAPIMVYGVVNLILSLVSIGGIVILIIDRDSQITTLSHAIWVCVFLVLVDGLVNVILFIINESDYHSWCINSSSSTIQNDFSQTNNSTSFNFQNDYYNCHHMWQDELKFGIISYILMFAFYIYWSMCIYSFRLYRPEYISDADIRHAQSHNMPLMGAPSMPQTAMINNPAAPAGPYPPDRSVIVLNNHKPSKKKSKFDSFKHIKKSMRPNRTVTPLHRNDSQFTIGFKLGPDGKIIDIESAPSPTPTYTAVDYFKRKPIQEDDEDDENDDKYYY